jgi:hypothetical protein
MKLLLAMNRLVHGSPAAKANSKLKVQNSKPQLKSKNFLVFTF